MAADHWQARVPVDVNVLRVWWVHWHWLGWERVHWRATWHCGLLTLHCAAVWPEAVLPREPAQSHGIGSAARDTARRAQPGVCVCRGGTAQKIKWIYSLACTFCTCAGVFKRSIGGLTVLIVAILHQVLVDGVRHLWLAVVPFHIHQQMVPFTLQHRETQSEWAGD